MTGPTGATSTLAQPAGPDAGAARVPWYRRRAVLVVAGIVVVVAAAVVVDLPRHASRSSQVATDAQVVDEINTDIGPCRYAVTEAFTLYRALTDPATSAADRGRVPALLTDDQRVCSFTDSDIVDLASIEIPGTAAGSHLRRVVDSVTLWVTGDALAAVEAIQTLAAKPADATALASLDRARHEMVADQRIVAAQLAAAERALGARPGHPDLPRLPLPAPPR
ncbi:MAG TPA: hypothetical protein VMV22_04820 [Acidimicrobiales bacterium]|nr:hypothetical protein [Acidimicrobiales bacterium]